MTIYLQTMSTFNFLHQITRLLRVSFICWQVFIWPNMAELFGKSKPWIMHWRPGSWMRKCEKWPPLSGWECLQFLEVLNSNKHALQNSQLDWRDLLICFTEFLIGQFGLNSSADSLPDIVFWTFKFHNVEEHFDMQNLITHGKYFCLSWKSHAKSRGQ